MPPLVRFVILLLRVAYLLPATMSLGAAASSAAASGSTPLRPAAPSSPSSSDCPIGEDVALSSRRCAGARFLYKDVVQVRVSPLCLLFVRCPRNKTP